MRHVDRLCTLVLLGAALAGCSREDRDVQSLPPGAAPEGAVRESPLQPGPPTRDVDYRVYGDNAWAISEGKRLFSWYNCAGCHSPGGGGAIGPPLIDEKWIYGSEPENIFETIQEGRPNGMPSFRGRISTADTWKLVAYVRSLSALTREDARAARADQMQEANPRIRAGKEVDSVSMKTARPVKEP